MVFALPGDPVQGGAVNGRVRRPTWPSSGRSTTWTSRCWCSTSCTWATLLQGDLGTTFNGNEVAHELPIRYPTTIKLALMAIIFEIVIGISAGVLAGIRRGKFVDNLVLSARWS